MVYKPLPLNPNEPNPNYMVYQELARKLLVKSLMSKGQCYLILGQSGIGKTTFLLWLKDFSHLYKLTPIFFHGGKDITIEYFKKTFEEAISPSFISRMINKQNVTNKPLLLIIDDIQSFTKEDIFPYICSKLDDPHLNLSMVLSTAKKTQKIKETLNKMVIEEITLKMPKKGILMEMIRKRIEAGGGKKFQPFGGDIVEGIINESKTLREILTKLEKKHNELTTKAR
jgi:energy-coupling factor transporter ATP-binding protein EcfA2